MITSYVLECLLDVYANVSLEDFDPERNRNENSFYIVCVVGYLM